MIKQLLLLTIAIHVVGIGYGQGFVGETEQQIRSNFKDNPAAEFHVNYVDNERVLTAVDNSIQMSAMFNCKGICCWTLMYIYDPKVLDTIVRGLNSRTSVVKQGEAWLSVHKGYKVHSKIGYSARMKATYLLFYSDELKYGSNHKKRSSITANNHTKAKTIKKKTTDARDMSLQDFMKTLPVEPTKNGDMEAIYKPIK